MCICVQLVVSCPWVVRLSVCIGCIQLGGIPDGRLIAGWHPYMLVFFDVVVALWPVAHAVSAAASFCGWYAGMGGLCVHILL